jgi:hypothetical protein
MAVIDLNRRLYEIKYRCTNEKSTGFKRYGGRGIKCLLTVDDLRLMWERDNGKSMLKPSVDRIDNDGHYELSNCRFIEAQENLLKSLNKKNFTHSTYVTIPPKKYRPEQNPLWKNSCSLCESNKIDDPNFCRKHLKEYKEWRSYARLSRNG